jgi:RNA polymerase sigma-70 factor (ECF subfamily)
VTRKDDQRVTELALRAGAGDARAVELFVEATYQDVWRFCCHLQDGSRADDLTQETFIRALGSLSRFAGRSSARTWLLSIARRTVVDHIRYETSRPPAAHHDHDETHPVELHHRQSRHEEQVEWAMLIDDLEPERREAFLLTQLLGLSYADAAEVCGCPIGTIRSRVARARDDLLAAHTADERKFG